MSTDTLQMGSGVIEPVSQGFVRDYAGGLASLAPILLKTSVRVMGVGVPTAYFGAPLGPEHAGNLSFCGGVGGVIGSPRFGAQSRVLHTSALRLTQVGDV